MNIETANRLYELRKQNGLSQEEVADKLGISRQAVSKWERAEASPDTDNLILLSKLYNVTLDELLNSEKSIEYDLENPKEEVIACKRLLHDLNLYPHYPTLVSCPTCGRTQVDVQALATKILEYLETVNKPIHVAVMGCVVNGPGEAKNADIGIAGGHHEFVIFKKNEIIKKVPEEEAFEVLKREIEKL